MTIHFYKYHGAGNDFVIIDNQNGECDSLKTKPALVHFICNRHLGVGADGLILINTDITSHFEMVYFNSDGYVGSMCGNGGRCAVYFAHLLKITDKKAYFKAFDGYHHAEIINIHEGLAEVRLQMTDIKDFRAIGDDYFVNTGSPHLVCFSKDIKNIDVLSTGSKLRYDKRFSPQGTNVNFVENIGDTLHIRTYERGVENETLACGTGITASVIAWALKENLKEGKIKVEAIGGTLSVEFVRNNNDFENVWLQGPAQMVYKGEITI